MEYPKTPHIIKATRITNIFSGLVIGTISPYPIVKVVIVLQYNEVMYFPNHYSFNKLNFSEESQH